MPKLISMQFIKHVYVIRPIIVNLIRVPATFVNYAYTHRQSHGIKIRCVVYVIVHLVPYNSW